MNLILPHKTSFFELSETPLPNRLIRQPVTTFSFSDPLLFSGIRPLREGITHFLEIRATKELNHNTPSLQLKEALGVGDVYFKSDRYNIGTFIL